MAEILDSIEKLVDAFPAARIGTGTIKLYDEAFAGESPELLDRAVDRLIASSKFFPSVAEIKAELCILQPDAPQFAQSRSVAAPSAEDLAEYSRIRELLVEGVPCEQCLGGGLLLNDETGTPWRAFWPTRHPHPSLREYGERGLARKCEACNGEGLVLAASQIQRNGDNDHARA